MMDCSADNILLPCADYPRDSESQSERYLVENLKAISTASNNLESKFLLSILCF